MKSLRRLLNFHRHVQSANILFSESESLDQFCVCVFTDLKYWKSNCTFLSVAFFSLSVTLSHVQHLTSLLPTPSSIFPCPLVKLSLFFFFPRFHNVTFPILAFLDSHFFISVMPGLYFSSPTESGVMARKRPPLCHECTCVCVVVHLFSIFRRFRSTVVNRICLLFLISKWPDFSLMSMTQMCEVKAYFRLSLTISFLAAIISHQPIPLSTFFDKYL